MKPPFRTAFCPPIYLPLRPQPTPLYTTNNCRCCAQPPDHHIHVSRRTALVALGAFALNLVSPINISDTKAATASEGKRTAAPVIGFLTRSGIKFFDFEKGEGRTPKWGDLVNIQYVAYTLTLEGDALVKQDSSYSYGDDGYLVHHGNGQLILGLEEMIHSMRVGGRRRAIIPSGMAYTMVDLGPVPAWDFKRRRFANALKDTGGTVVFDVEVRSIMDDPTTRETYEELTPTPEQVGAYLRNEILTLE